MKGDDVSGLGVMGGVGGGLAAAVCGWADAVELLRVALASEPAVTGRTFTGRAGG